MGVHRRMFEEKILSMNGIRELKVELLIKNIDSGKKSQKRSGQEHTGIFITYITELFNQQVM